MPRPKLTHEQLATLRAMRPHFKWGEKKATAYQLGIHPNYLSRLLRGIERPTPPLSAAA